MFEGPLRLAYAADRVRRFLSPSITITAPPVGVRFERDVAVPVRDGTILRVNVFRPAAEGRYPVMMCAHPYGKDNLPQPGYRLPINYRLWRQPAPYRLSVWTSWEAPDPAYWVPGGYVLVNCDLRGFGRSEGVGSLLTEAEGRTTTTSSSGRRSGPGPAGASASTASPTSRSASGGWRRSARPTWRRSAPGRALATPTGTSPIRAGSARTRSCRSGAR